MTHAEMRIIERLIKEANMEKIIVSRIMQQVGMMARNTHKSMAIRVGKVNFQGQAWTDKSNGDQVWVIVRGQEVKTVMFRRSTQPDSPESMRVDRVVKFH